MPEPGRDSIVAVSVSRCGRLLPAIVMQPNRQIPDANVPVLVSNKVVVCGTITNAAANCTTIEA